jgi:hypothetical protein
LTNESFRRILLLSKDEKSIIYEIMAVSNPKQENLIPGAINDFIVAFVRTTYTLRLYSSGHDHLQKNVNELLTKFKGALENRDFLFVGCAKDTLFLEGTFYQATDVQLERFLRLFHSLRISHVILDKEITAEEIESFIELLAGAQQGQGEEVSSALLREDIIHVRLGLFDYNIFNTVQAIAAKLSKTSEDEAIWLLLIMQPTASGAFNLSPKMIEQLTNLSGDAGVLKRFLLQMDTAISKSQKGISAAQRGLLLGNFIQNVGNALEGIDPEKRKQFTKNAGVVIDSLDPELKTHILGTVGADQAGQEKRNVIQEILQAMPDGQFVSLLTDALKEAGKNSPCFNNLINYALTKYEESDLLLNFIREEMDRSTQEGDSTNLNCLQQIEQLIIQQQEIVEFNLKYHSEIEALATSIMLEGLMGEEAEMERLFKTLNPDFIGESKARLIIDLIGRSQSRQEKELIPSQLEGLREILVSFLGEKRFQLVGGLLRELFLALSNYKQTVSVWRSVRALIAAKAVRDLLGSLLEKVRTYSPKETRTIEAICQLFPEKAGGVLLDTLIEQGGHESAQSRWLTTTLASLGPRLTKILDFRLQDAPDKSVPALLTLANISADPSLAPSVGKFMDHKDYEIQLKVISALGKMKAESVVSSLAGIISKRYWVKTKKVKSLQMAAARALADIGTDEARSFLAQVANSGSRGIHAFCKELI